jgi:hypothetical protein
MPVSDVDKKIENGLQKIVDSLGMGDTGGGSEHERGIELLGNFKAGPDKVVGLLGIGGVAQSPRHLPVGLGDYYSGGLL